VDENHTRRSIVSGSSEERAECGCILLSVLVGSKINVGWAFSPTILNLGGWKLVKNQNSNYSKSDFCYSLNLIFIYPSPELRPPSPTRGEGNKSHFWEF